MAKDKDVKRDDKFVEQHRGDPKGFEKALKEQAQQQADKQAKR